MSLAAASPSPPSGAQARPCILVVDDEPEFRTTVGGLLKCCGYDVILAADGSEAMNHAQRRGPDLMLLDLVLPSDPFGGGNFDGFGVMKWLKRLGIAPRMPIVIVSGRHDETTRNQAVDLGAAGFLAKPLRGSELLETVRTALNGVA